MVSLNVYAITLPNTSVDTRYLSRSGWTVGKLKLNVDLVKFPLDRQFSRSGAIPDRQSYFRT